MSVTIEDKIELFSKMIFENIENESSEKKNQVKEKHQEELAKLLQELEEKKLEYKTAAIEKAEKERAKLLAKSKTNQQHLLIEKKQQLLEQVMNQLQKMAVDFTYSEEYRGYLKNSIETCLEAFKDSKQVIFYTQGKDIQLCEEILKSKLNNPKYEIEYKIQAASKDIIGGLIAVDGGNLLQLEMNLKTLLQENEDVIGAEITRKFNEVSSL